MAVVVGSLSDNPGDFIEMYDLAKKKRIAVVPGSFQGVEFISDTTFASETQKGFLVFNTITRKSRMLQEPKASVKDNIGYGPNGKILFDSTRIFDFEKLELQNANTRANGFSRGKAVLQFSNNRSQK